MKQQIKFLLPLLIILSNPLFSQDNILLKDYDGNIVDFFLVSNDGKTVINSTDGQMPMSQLKTLKKKKFTLHFENRLAYLLYHNDVYFKNGHKKQDEHISYNKIKYTNLLTDEDGIFYVRRKEIRLDDENNEEEDRH